MMPPKHRVLITGASGLLGSNFVCLRPASWEIIALTHQHVLHVPLAGVVQVQANLLIRDLDAILGSLSPPDAIIHTAALTNVDQCEREPAFAHALNVDLAIAVARYASARGIHLVHVSTDHIFDGYAGRYSESSVPNPMNVYAATKLAAEEGVRAIGGMHTIVRTNFFGFNMQEKQDLAGWMRAQFAQHAPMRLFVDVRCSPLIANTLVAALVEIVERKITGTLHVAAADGCSKYDFGMMLARAFCYDVDAVTPISIDDAGLDVPRPKDMTLDTNAARAILSTSLPTVAASIERYRELAVTGYERTMKRMAAAWVQPQSATVL